LIDKQKKYFSYPADANKQTKKGTNVSDHVISLKEGEYQHYK